MNNIRAMVPASMLKWLLALVLILNARSLPLVWHYRVFLPLIKIRLRYLALRSKLFLTLKPSRQKEQTIENFMTSLAPIGCNPFERSVIYHTWASIDDCDFNMHLSNSSYPKTLDCARFKAALDFFPQFLRAGGVLPLAGTHFHFIREIPLFARYELRLTMGSWDEKWFYVVGRFVTKPGQVSKRKQVDARPATEGGLSILTPNDAASSTTGTPKGAAGTPDINGLASKLVPSEEPDGAILHTIAISQVCCKIGRITVPPALVIASNGFTGKTGYSRANPPQNWLQVESMISKSSGGHIKNLNRFYKGAWKDIPPTERWWEDALGGVIEEQRKERLAAIEGVRKGMEGARNFC